MNQREIKFRAWDKEWGMYFFGIPYSESKACDLVGMENPIFMQYTGLKDKNGKEIYENDVVKNQHDDLAEVEYEAPKFIAWFPIDDSNDGSGYEYDDSFDKYEVIGNIYENPELL